MENTASFDSKVMRFFKNIPQRLLSHNIFTKNIFLSRYEVYRSILGRDYAQGLLNNSPEQIMLNQLSLGRLVSTVWKLEEEEDLEAATWNLHYTNPRIDNVLSALVGLGSCPLNLGNIQSIDLILTDYDIGSNFYTFYFNMNSVAPIAIYHCGDVQIIYRGYTEYQLRDFLVSIAVDFGEYFAFTEPYFISHCRAFCLKREIVMRYVDSELRERECTESKFKFIIEDAYNNLIHLSSLFLEKEKSERVKILNNYRDRFRDNLFKSYKRGFYVPLVIDEEFKIYEELISRFNTCFIHMGEWLTTKKGDIPYGIKQRYIVDQTDKQSNKYKINLGAIKKKLLTVLVYNRKINSIIEQVHPDILMGLYILMYHINISGLSRLYYAGSPLQHMINRILSIHFKRKPLLIKYLFKNGADDYLHFMKEEGLLLLHQLENFFGYRVGITILEEIKEDYENWFNMGIEKYSEVQRAFIEKWAFQFFNYVNYKGKRIADIIRENLTKYVDFKDILGDEYQYMNGHGMVDDTKVTDTKGKMRSVNKNIYFRLYSNPKDYQRTLDNHAVRRNKVIIKREELIKQRIVINSTLNTFVPLSQINRFIQVIVNNTGVLYMTNSKAQKAEHYVRLQNYLLYNKVKDKRYLCLPLDYSSYDHTITKGFISEVIHQLAVFTGYSELDTLQQKFWDILSREVIYMKELEGDPANNKKYKYGILSGWKITSSVESLGNAIITYGVMQELGLNLVDLETMGDDLIIILDKAGLDRNNQLKLLEKVCLKYQDLGFQMNVPKNSIGYNFLEFLRVTFRPGICQCYPTRILGAMFYLKPGKEEENFGVQEATGVLNKVVKRYGIGSMKIKIADDLFKHYNLSNIRKFGAKYTSNPWGFAIKQREKVKYSFKVDVESTPMFKKFQRIVGEEYSTIISRIIGREIVDKKVVINEVYPLPKPERMETWERSILVNLCDKFRKNIELDQEHKFYVPDYHMGEVLKEIISKNKSRGVDWAKHFLLDVNRKMDQDRWYRRSDFQRNIEAIGLMLDFSDIFASLGETKIKISERFIPALILSRVKTKFIGFLKKELKDKRDLKRYMFIRSLLNKSKRYMIAGLLGELLADKSEILGFGSKMPIAWFAD